MGGYTDIYYQPSENTVFSYRSGSLVYEETFADGMLVSSGYNTAGFPLNVLSNCPSRINHRRIREPQSFKLEINGQTIDNGWKLAKFEKAENEKGCTGIVTLDNSYFDISAKIYTILDGTQMLSRYIEISNNSNTYLNISRLSVLSGALQENTRTRGSTNNADMYELGYFDGDSWGCEGEFNWHSLSADCHSFDTRYDSDRYRYPALFIKNKKLGTMFFSQLSFTGGCNFSADLRSFDNDSSILSIDIGLSGLRPLYVLSPGETLTSPEVMFGMITGDLDAAVNEMISHIRLSVLKNDEKCDGLLVGCGMGAEHDMSVETTKAFMRQMKEMGGEVFIVDAGWQCPPDKEMQWNDFNGLNVPDNGRYPNGIGELSDYAKEIGLKFGMWMEPERLGCFSEMYESHSAWFPTNFFGKKQNGLIDLTIPEAAKWVEDEIARVITEYKLDLLRIDHNGSLDYFCMKDVNGSGMPECQNIRMINAIYAMYRRLKKRFPDVIFENCAGGGGRCDTGMMKAFNHTWVSDWQRSPQAHLITNGITLVLPPERVDRLFAGMGSHETGSLAINMRNTMLGHMSLNVINPASADINSDVMSFVKHSVQLYKSFIRPFMKTAKIYHHNPEYTKAIDDGFLCNELASDDKSKAVIHAFTLTFPGKSVFRIYPKGLDRSKKYKVTFDNSGESTIFDGFSLMNDGLRLDIPAALSSELIIFEAI